MINKVIYFAHPMSLYGTPMERRLMSRLESAGWTVVNPSAKKHQERVNQIKKEFPPEEAGERVMEYFVSLCRTCGGIAFTPFPDGSIGAGVAKEAAHFVENKKVLIEATWDNEKGRVILNRKNDLSGYRILSIDETRAMLTKLAPNYAARLNPVLQ
jgi:hypothetical protein